MTQEIQDRNEQIALMLGYVNTTPTDKDFNIFKSHIKIGVIPNMIETMSMKFHSDWNWLMEAVEFINKTHKNNNPYRDLHYTMGYLLHGGWWGETKVPERLLSDKTELFLAVSDFAKLYNDKKL